MSKIVSGTGDVPVANGSQVGGKLQEYDSVGPFVAFNLPLHAPYWYFLPRDQPFGGVFSSANGTNYSVMAQAPSRNPERPNQADGGVAHLDQYQAYEKQGDGATLRVTLSDLLLQNVDDNNELAAWECPATGNCEPVRTVVRFHVRAYAASAGGDFFDEGGVAYLEGHQHAWRPGAATSADSAHPLWGENDFDVDGDADDSNTGAAGVMYINHAIRVKVPLASVHGGELFAVHVSLEAQAVDERGYESAAQAFIQDPQKPGTGLLTAHGLKRRGKPRFKEPRAKPPAPARCPKGTPRHAGAMQFSDAGFSASESESSPMILVTRTGGSHGSASATLTTEAGSARAGSDFRKTSTTVRFANGDTGPRLVEVPLREDSQSELPETFTVKLGNAHCGALGRRRSAKVTINDDEGLAPAGPAAAAFTIGGTVDGLQGSGLLLSNLGAPVAISANGGFSFPGTASTGQPYEVKVANQPHNPDQICSVANGTGTVGTANVTNIAVHCVTQAIPSGLDPTFGGGGRISTPVGGDGHGEALVIQPSGDIVTAGWHATAGGDDFALTRHDSTGKFDTTFGTNGIASTDFGGDDDEAYDAALLSDGGIVAVGRTDATSAANTDFAVARYDSEGKPDMGFDSDGKLTTDVLGRGDQANAVAVQSDGKIVVAGSALVSAIDNDFALVRYSATGVPDDDFNTDGKVTTDMGTNMDSARAVLIQPDDKILVVGTAGENIALARYTSGGDPDMMFGTAGKTITNLGQEAVATGVALTSDGHILISGYTLGANIDRDFMLARYTSGGVLDDTFGDHGIVKTDLGDGDDFAENLTVDDQGRIILVGRASSSTILDMALVRYTPEGVKDTTFNGDGILTADFHGLGEFGQDVAIDADGKIVAAGYTANGGDLQFALMRANP